MFPNPWLNRYKSLISSQLQLTQDIISFIAQKKKQKGETLTGQAVPKALDLVQPIIKNPSEAETHTKRDSKFHIELANARNRYLVNETNSKEKTLNSFTHITTKVAHKPYAKGQNEHKKKDGKAQNFIAMKPPQMRQFSRKSKEKQMNFEKTTKKP